MQNEKNPIKISKYERFIHKNYDKEFSKNISEDKFIDNFNKNKRFFEFNEDGLSKECDKCHCYESKLLKMDLPDLDTVKGKIEIQSAKNRIKNYLEDHIQNEIEKEIEKVKYKIEKEIRKKYHLARQPIWEESLNH